jgi:hypothetical protein
MRSLVSIVFHSGMAASVSSHGRFVGSRYIRMAFPIISAQTQPSPLSERTCLSMKLIIAEKPSVAHLIAKVVGATDRKGGYLTGADCAVCFRQWREGGCLGKSL